MVVIITKYNIIRRVVVLFDGKEIQSQMINELAAMKELDFIDSVKKLMFPELKAMGAKRYTIQ